MFSRRPLLVEEVAGLVDQADDDVGHHFWRTSFEEGAEGFKGYPIWGFVLASRDAWDSGDKSFPLGPSAASV
jgi:hypothetical protein